MAKIIIFGIKLSDRLSAIFQQACPPCLLRFFRVRYAPSDVLNRESGLMKCWENRDYSKINQRQLDKFYPDPSDTLDVSAQKIHKLQSLVYLKQIVEADGVNKLGSALFVSNIFMLIFAGITAIAAIIPVIENHRSNPTKPTVQYEIISSFDWSKLPQAQTPWRFYEATEGKTSEQK